MLYLVIILSTWTMLILKCASSDSTVRLYDSFAEIQQAYKGPLRFRQIDWDNIKHESIFLQLATENNNTTNMVFKRRIVRINANSTGL